jgi:hypothetical protein
MVGILEEEVNKTYPTAYSAPLGSTKKKKKKRSSAVHL